MRRGYVARRGERRKRQYSGLVNEFCYEGGIVGMSTGYEVKLNGVWYAEYEGMDGRIIHKVLDGVKEG